MFIPIAYCRLACNTATLKQVERITPWHPFYLIIFFQPYTSCISQGLPAILLYRLTGHIHVLFICQFSVVKHIVNEPCCQFLLFSCFCRCVFKFLLDCFVVSRIYDSLYKGFPFCFPNLSHNILCTKGIYVIGQYIPVIIVSC